MTREDINNIISAICPNDEDFEKPIISPKYLKTELEQLALEQEPCEDCISRQAVDELSKELVHTTKDKADFLCNFWEGLQKLPPVTQEPNTGHWIVKPNIYGVVYCSECDYELKIDDTNYCPNCGAMMIESQENKPKTEFWWNIIGGQREDL